MKHTLGAAATAFLMLPQAAYAQPIQWTDFPPQQSLLVFDAPGLSNTPTRAVEGHQTSGRKSNVRRFGYIFSTSFAPGAFAQIYVWSINAELTSFSDAPAYDSLITSFYQEFKGRTVEWGDAAALTANTPIGPTKYRRFTVSGRSCLAFGGVYGGAPSVAFSSGSYGKGSEQIFGYYCAPRNHRLSEQDSQLVLSRLGFGTLGKPTGNAPKGFETSPPQVPTPAATATAATKGVLQERQLVVLWEGYTGGITGTVLLDPAAATSRLEIRIASEGLTCIGISSSNKSGEGDWTVQCPNGVAANGKFRALGRDRGSIGEGIDNNGAKVSFVMAGR